MRKDMKFSKGGRAEAQRDRRLADIESDYQKALARGKSEKEARAKREQRLADARDDYAKRTGADRTETRAAERAAEARLSAARLSAARRSPDKDMKAVSVASDADKPATTKVDLTAKVDTPSVSGKPAPKPVRRAARPAPKPVRRAARPAPKPVRRAARPAPKPAPKAAPKTTASAPKAAPKPQVKPDSMASYRAAATRMASESPEVKRRVSQLLSGPITDPRKVVARETENRNTSRAQAEARRRVAALGLKPARSKEPVSTRYAKGGKVDGAAVRGKTKGMRKK